MTAIQLSKNEIYINNIHATYNDSCFIKNVYTMNICHSNDCNYYKCVNAIAKGYTLSHWPPPKRLQLLWVCKRRSTVTHSQVDCHSHDCNYYECVNAGAMLHTRKSCDTQPIAPEWNLFLDWWVFLKSLKLIFMVKNTCTSLKLIWAG